MTAVCSHTDLQTLEPVIDRFTSHCQGNFSRCIHNPTVRWIEILVPLGADTFLQHRLQFIVQWIEVWANEGPAICFNEIWDTLLQPFLNFLLCKEEVQNLTESPTHLHPKVQFPLETVRHYLTWLGDLKKWIWVALEYKSPHQNITMIPLKSCNFVFDLITSFGIYMANWILVDIENHFIGKQDLVCSFYNLIFFCLVSNK